MTSAFFDRSRLRTIAEAAAQAGVSTTTVRSWELAGQIKKYKFGAAAFYDTDEIDAVVASRKTKGAAHGAA